ncbi:conserved hypothetical protein [Sphingomonas sp. EC-HK361]|uniref:DUF2971 domain-containing protein n=1 Tax=Sphingomonas sp. EC-HK361 TaxID=2038397 RepID=UPI001251CC2B|nr:DUF2971 domain-containing protein [Sphingomonas sp. EC-HK361]VVT13053.1 conserved hypothetical protein [Sphingomonas sp. EC-HK361]
MNENEAIEAFSSLAFPYEMRRFQEVAEKGLKMAHYTTAENAALILKNRALWLRNAQLMNDFSEVAYGTSCLQLALEGGQGAGLQQALDAAHPGLWKAIADFLNEIEWQTRTQTYLTSLSAHDPDDFLGRLSMWRAYGGPTSGVALIFNTEVFEHESGQLNTYSSPVAYGDQFIMAEHLNAIVTGIAANADILKRVPFNNAKAIMSNALQFATLSFKHPAFAEEQEWRVIHRPLTDASAYIPTSIETVRGIPQMICKVPLCDQPGLEMPWLNLDQLLNRIIIGPCVYPNQVAWAFQEILRGLGIDPAGKISIAAIPLRQQG